MNKLNISAIILVHDSKSKLNKTLESVNFASEIIIVDNNSNIDWYDLKKKYPLKIIVHPEQVTDFSELRNIAAKSANNEWLFFIDSDEVLLGPAEAKIAALIDSQADGGVITRSDVFKGKKLEYGEAGNQSIIRFGKKDSLTFQGKVHEVASIQGELQYTGLHISHYAHESIKEFISDVSKYAQIAAQEKTAGFGQNLFEMLTFPFGKLLYGLFIQAGIMDGWPGVVYAYCMSLHSLLVRIYRYEILAKASNLPKA